MGNQFSSASSHLKFRKKKVKSLYNGETHYGCEINRLPDEILEFIFTFLNVKERLRTELVCQRWRQLGRTVKWSGPLSVDVHLLSKLFKNTCTNAEIISAVLPRCGLNLNKLTLNLEYSERRQTTRVLDLTAKSCPNLKELTIAIAPGVEVSKHALINLAKRCTKLKRFGIGCADFGDDDLSCFLEQCQSLDYLSLSIGVSITEQCLDAVKTKLRGFYLFKYRHVDISAFAEKLLVRCDPMEALRLIESRFLSEPLLLQLLCLYKTTLKVLTLDGNSVEYGKWCEIPVMLNHLEELSVRFSKGVDDHFVQLLAENCKGLRVLNISGTDITDAGIAALASLPSLQELDVSCTHFVTGAGTQSLARKGQLRKLHFCYINSGNSLIEDNYILLANSCSDLRLLNLSGNHNITNRLVEKVSLSAECGFFKTTVSIWVSDTKVTKNVACCDKLELNFDPDVDFLTHRRYYGWWS